MKASILIMKFGGAAVATPEQFEHIARIVIERKKHFDNVAIVVSAMGDTTDELISLALKVNANPPQREYDMLVTVGERISIALLAMALHKQGCEAISFTGSQSGIITNDNHREAKIVEVRPNRLLKAFSEGKVVIVAGFQGVSRSGEITTLGRGGSDTSAVALGIALGAQKVEFYKDVEGIYSEDPKENADAQKYAMMEYEQLLELLNKGSGILHSRCVELAQKNFLPLHVLSFEDFLLMEGQGTNISSASILQRPLQPIYESN